MSDTQTPGTIPAAASVQDAANAALGEGLNPSFALPDFMVADLIAEAQASGSTIADPLHDRRARDIMHLGDGQFGPRSMVIDGVDNDLPFKPFIAYHPEREMVKIKRHNLRNSYLRVIDGKVEITSAEDYELALAACGTQLYFDDLLPEQPDYVVQATGWRTRSSIAFQVAVNQIASGH